MRGTFDARQHENAGLQVEAAYRRSPVSGPRIVLKQEGATNAYGTMLGAEDRDGVWVLSYWFIHDARPEEARLHLSWSEAGIDVNFTIGQESMTEALDAVEDLTELPWTTQETEIGPDL
jgi:hypothetical protein